MKLKTFILFFVLSIATLQTKSQDVEWMLYDTFYGGDFKDGVTSFYYEGKYGLMNSSGEVLIPPIYKYSFEFIDNLAVIRDPATDLQGVINRDGDYVIKPIYKAIYKPERGFIRAFDEDYKGENPKQTIYNYSGKMLLPSAKYELLYISTDSTIEVKIDDTKRGLLNKYGVTIFDNTYKRVGSYFGSIGYAESTVSQRRIIKHLYMDLQFECDESYVCGENILGVVGREVKGKKEFFDNNLNLITTPINASSSGLYYYYDETAKLYGFKNAENEIVVAPKYHRVVDAYDKRNNCFYVILDNKYGVVDGTIGSENIKPEYKSSLKFDKNGYAIVETDKGVKGIVKIDGTIVLPTVYNSLNYNEKNEIYELGIGKKSGIFNHLSSIKEPLMFETCWLHTVGDGMIIVANNNKYGYINLLGELVIPCQYNHYGIFSEGLAIVRDANHKKSMIDKTGNILCEDNDVFTIRGDMYSEGVLRIYDRKGNKEGYINNPLMKSADVKELYSQTLTLTQYKNTDVANNKTIQQKEHYYSNSDEEYNKAYNFFLSSDYQSAVNVLYQLISVNPNNADYYNLMGACYHNVEDYSNAIQFYKNALEIDENHSNAKANMKKAKRARSARNWEIASAVLNGVADGLNSASTVLYNQNSSYQSTNSGSNSRSSSTTTTMKTCTVCKGTGKVDGYVATFGNTEQKFCEECDRLREASHCHGCKLCPGCGGKGERSF